MRSYDEIPDFKYYNKDSWKNFISTHIKHLNHLSSKLLEFRDFILKSGKTLSEIEENRSDLLPFLLGGIDKDGEYKEDSLAEFVKFALGIWVNAKHWVVLGKEEGKEASGRISIDKEEKQQFLGFIEKLREITSAVMRQVEIEPEEIPDSEIEEIVKKPEKLLEIVKEMYVECLNASANHSYYTFFALSTRNLPYGFMIAAYPKLESNFEDDFLGLKKIFEPEIGDEEIRKKYTIWGHKKDGLCDLLYELNESIWNGFSNEKVKEVLSYVSTSVNDLREEYRQKVEEELTHMGREPLEKVVRLSDYTGDNDRYGANRYKYIIEEGVLTNCYYQWVTKSRKLSASYDLGKDKDGNPKFKPIHLAEFFDNISPELFLLSPFLKLELSNEQLIITDMSKGR